MHSSLRLLLGGALFAGLLLLASCAAWLLDARMLDGVSVWSKPMKFNFSFGLHLLTTACLLRYAATTAWAGNTGRWSVRVLVAATVTELAYITLQAARGRRSHFNFDTAWERVAYYGLMGGGALTALGATVALGLLLWRHPRAGLPPALHWGAVGGLVGGAVATLLTASVLASGAVAGPGHWIGGLRSDATGLPLAGWSTTGGDLRVPHFFATHLTQALPLAGLMATRLNLRHPRAWVAAAAGAGLAVVALSFMQALAGRPFATGW